MPSSRAFRFPAPDAVRRFQQRLLRWYRRHGRGDLPWRRHPTSYRVLVAEVMLQQTQTNHVVPKYCQFLRRYPTIQALARADGRTLLRLWSGLGYNRRALLLRECARQIVRDHHGRVPHDYATLRALPGVGSYTAHAVNIFSRNHEEVCVDTNVRRVLTNEFKLPPTLSEHSLAAIAERVLPRGRSRQWHSALMDYGALVATARHTGLRPRTVQSQFRGSNRYYRGQLMKLLVRHRRCSLAEAARQLHLPHSAVRRITLELQRDGLLIWQQGRFRLPS